MTLRDALLKDTGDSYIKIGTHQGKPIYMKEPTLAEIMALHMKIDSDRLDLLAPAYALRFLKQQQEDGSYTSLFEEPDYDRIKNARVNSPLGALVQVLCQHILILTGKVVPQEFKDQPPSKKK